MLGKRRPSVARSDRAPRVVQLRICEYLPVGNWSRPPAAARIQLTCKAKSHNDSGALPTAGGGDEMSGRPVELRRQRPRAGLITRPALADSCEFTGRGCESTWAGVKYALGADVKTSTRKL